MGNTRPAINRETLGVPVIAIGVPTVVDAVTLASELLEENGIPFSLVLPTAPVARDEMTDAEFNAMMQTGLNAAKTDRSRGASEVFADLRRGL